MFLHQCCAIFTVRAIFFVRKIVSSDYQLSGLSVHLPACNKSVPTERIFFFLNLIVEDSSKICRESGSFTKIWRVTGNLYDALWAFVITPRLILRRMRNGSDIVEEKIKTSVWYSISFSEYRADNVWKYGTPGMSFGCWIIKDKNAHSEYVTLLFHGNNVFAKAFKCYVYT
jgi:hypothetical protein